MSIAVQAIAVWAIAETGDLVTDLPSIDLSRPDIIYACEISPGLRGWGFVDDISGIAVAAIAETPAIERAMLADPFYVATHAYATDAGDSPASTRFAARLSALSFRRSLANGQDFSGVAQGDGQLTIDNGDGHFDPRIGQIISGREIVIKAGPADTVYAAWKTVFRGTARGWSFDESAIHIDLRDDSYRLGVAIQETLYTGAGGAEGGDALKDKRKPLLLGRATNVTPPQVAAAQLTYQIHDGAIDAVFAVRDRGVPLSFGADRANYAALAAASISAGHYDTCLAEGFIRLGSVPEGTVTADAATYRSTGAAPLATIVRGILADRAGITRFDAFSFTLLGSQYPTDHGTWLSENDNPTVAEVLAGLLGGVMAHVAFRRDGRCYVQALSSPEGAADRSYSLGKVIEISRERLPARLSPPPWRLRLYRERNHTPQTDLAGAADQIWAQPGTVVSAQDSDVKLDHLLAQDAAPADSFMHDEAAATAEVLRQFEIISTERPLRRVRLPRQALLAEIGDLCEVAFDRLGGTRRGVNVEDAIEFSRSDAQGASGGIDSVELLLYG